MGDSFQVQSAPRSGVRICALVPCHNNADTVCAVVRGLPAGTFAIVVDDGSDIPVSVSSPMCGVLRFPRNRGKAEALKAGFAEAAARGFTHAVALDADGQHPPELFGKFADAARANPDAIIAGVRDFSGRSVPPRQTVHEQVFKLLVQVRDIRGFGRHAVRVQVLSARKDFAAENFARRILLRGRDARPSGVGGNGDNSRRSSRGLHRGEPARVALPPDCRHRAVFGDERRIRLHVARSSEENFEEAIRRGMNFAEKCVRFAYRHRPALAAAFAAMCVAAFFAVKTAPFKTDAFDLLPFRDARIENAEMAAKWFGASDSLYFNVSARNPETARNCALALKGKLAKAGFGFAEFPDPAKAAPEIFRAYPSLFDDTAALERAVSKGEIRKRFAFYMRKMSGFEAPVFKAAFFSDPVGAVPAVLSNLKNLARGMGGASSDGSLGLGRLRKELSARGAGVRRPARFGRGRARVRRGRRSGSGGGTGVPGLRDRLGGRV